MPDDSNWKTPIASPRASISYVLRSSSGIFAISSPPPIRPKALSITSRLRSPRKSIFSRPSSSTSHIPNCVTVSSPSPFRCRGHDVGQRPVRDDDARGVDRVLPHEPLERLREVDDLAHERIPVVRRLQLGARLQAVVEVDLHALGDELRDLVDGAVGNLEHTPRVAHRGARHHRPERDDLRDAVAPVLVGDVVDHPVAAADREVDVHVRHRLAPRVEEALEEQVVLHRVDLGDVERVRGQRARRRAAARADRDAVPLREVDEVPDDQEVVREAHLADRLQLELEPFLDLGRHVLVALLEALLAELDEIVERIAALGHRVLREANRAELDLDRAALRDLERPRERSRVLGEVGRHLRRRLEVELVGVELPVIRVLQRVARLDAEERLVCARVFMEQVVHVAGRDERKPRALRELRELRVDPRLLGQPRVLDLDVGRLAAEDLDEPVEVGRGVGPARFLERLRDASGKASGERDQTLARASPAAPSRRAACSNNPANSPPTRA